MFCFSTQVLGLLGFDKRGLLLVDGVVSFLHICSVCSKVLLAFGSISLPSTNFCFFFSSTLFMEPSIFRMSLPLLFFKPDSFSFLDTKLNIFSIIGCPLDRVDRVALEELLMLSLDEFPFLQSPEL